MSNVIDATRKVHEVQLQAVTDGQDAVVELVRKAAEYLDRAPEAPESVQKLVEPIKSVVGSPAEFVRSITESNKDWAQAWLDFQTKLSAALTPVGESAVREPTPIKKSGSARGAKA